MNGKHPLMYKWWMLNLPKSVDEMIALLFYVFQCSTLFSRKKNQDWMICAYPKSTRTFWISFCHVLFASARNDFSSCVLIAVLTVFFSKICAVDVCITRTFSDCWSSFISQVQKESWSFIKYNYIYHWNAEICVNVYMKQICANCW